MSTKIRKGDVVLAKDLTEDYWGSEIEFERVKGVKTTLVLKKHRGYYENTMTYLFPEAGEEDFFTFVAADTELTILTPPWGHHPEKPTEMGTIIQVEGYPSSTCVVDYYGDILGLHSGRHVIWDSLKRIADAHGSKIIVFKPTASYEDGLTDIETRDDWDPSKEELYRTRQWEDVSGDIWSFRDGAWGYVRQDYGRRVELELPRYYTPLRLVPKDEEIS